MAQAKKNEDKEVTAQKPARAVTRKKEQTVRERAEKASSSKPRRIRRTASRASGPLKKVNAARSKYKGIHIRGRRIRFIPPFLVNAWKELRQVTWPDWSTTWRLTIAVFIFAVIFAAFVGLLDYVLGKIFKEVIINS